MLASFPKLPKTYRPKALKIDVFDYPLKIDYTVSDDDVAQ